MMALHGTLICNSENWCTYCTYCTYWCTYWHLLVFFPVVCFIHVFDQTLAQQLYRDKGLLLTTYWIRSLAVTTSTIRENDALHSSRFPSHFLSQRYFLQGLVFYCVTNLMFVSRRVLRKDGACSKPSVSTVKDQSLLWRMLRS